MVFIEDPTFQFDLGLFVLVIAITLYQRLGGWPEANYRIFRTPYIVLWIFEADLSPRKYVRKTSEIKPGKPPKIEARDGYWLLTPAEMSRDTGRPCWYFNHNEARPIPLFTWKNGGPDWDPNLIKEAFENDVLSRMHNLGLRPKPTLMFLVLVGIVIIAMFTFIQMYYSYNNFCALHAAQCGGVGH